MIKRLRRNLTLLFTIATGLILSLVLGTTCFYQFSKNRSNTNLSFRNQFLDLTNKLELDSSFSDTWLARLESEGQLIIHIEENGQPLFFQGSWNPKTNRDSLIRMAKEEALKEKVNTAQRPFSFSKLDSSVFSLRGEHRDTYIGSAVVLSTELGFRSMVLLADTTSQTNSYVFQGLFFLGLEVIGLISLFLVSRYVVGRAVKPVEEYHRKQTEFVAAASHELRSPLAVIQTCATAITTIPEQSPQMALSIQRESKRAGSLIKNLLLLASADSGTLQAQMENVEVDTLLLQIYESYEPLCQNKGIHLKLKLPEELVPEVYGAKHWIYQIIGIFMDNAITYGCMPAGEKVIENGSTVPKHSEKKSCMRRTNEIIINADFTKKEVLLSVVDHGPGISTEHKSQVFNRFYQMDPSRKDKEHFGLGLSIAGTLAKQMKANLTVEDTAGGGTTFVLHLLRRFE